MKKLFLSTIQEVMNFKTLLGNPKELTFRYLRMKGKYLITYPSYLDDKVHEIGY